MNDPTDPPCREFKRYMSELRDRLRRAYDENKWYLSETARHDVGLQAAKDDFHERHLDRFAGDVRTSFCGRECARRDSCPLARCAAGIPPVSRSLELHTQRRLSIRTGFRHG